MHGKAVTPSCKREKVEVAQLKSMPPDAAGAWEDGGKDAAPKDFSPPAGGDPGHTVKSRVTVIPADGVLLRNAHRQIQGAVREGSPFYF